MQTLSLTLNSPFSAVYLAICDREADARLRDAYHKTLIYVDCMQQALDNNEQTSPMSRRIQAFPMVVPSKFIDRVEILDVCALVVLAYYFAVAAQIDEHFWWLHGSRGERIAVREIQAINTFLADTCPALMNWPLVKAGIVI